MNPIGKMSRLRITSPLLAGMVNAFVWMCIGTVALSLILAWSDMKEQSLPSYAFVIHGIASAFGGFASGKRAGSRGWYHGAFLGILYTVAVVIIGFLGFDASLGTDTLTLLGIALAAGAFGGMIGVNTGR